MGKLFDTLHHVCIVVHDIERVEAYLRGLGIDDWRDYPKSSPYVEYEVPNPEGSSQLRYRCAQLSNVELQLCQPGEADSPQRRFLDERGEGVYHLGFEVDSMESSAEYGQKELGLEILGRGLRADGSGFCYFDTRADAGIVLEVRKSA